VLARSSEAVAERAVVVYNGVAGPPTVTEPRRDLPGEVRLLYVGRVSPRKGVDLLVEAVALLRDQALPARLDVAGSVFPGYEWYEDELRALAQQRGVTDRLTMHGFVSDVWPLLADADVVVVPSLLSEPFGNVAVEAALAARPVIVSDWGGLREAVYGLQSARRVPPGSASAVADAVSELVGDWARVRVAAHDDAGRTARRFGPDRYGREVLALITGAAGTHRTLVGAGTAG
jgi:glycosyltransferase involved in cell wall biosynthesis